jgi:pyruvate ferredoxin oxidoreductase beta subunit
MHHRWKKNVAPLMLAGHSTCKYVGTVSTSYPLQAMNCIRRALSVGGPTFIHCLNPCPKGWDFDPYLAYDIGNLAVNTGIWPLYEIENGVLKFYGKTQQIARGRFKRLPVRDYLLKQGRFAHFTDEDIEFFQSKVDEMWEKWLVPGVIPLRKELEADIPPAS